VATETQTPATRSPVIGSLLAQLRRRIRTYVWVQGIIALLVLLGVWFWASLAFDWVFEPPRELRIALLVVLGLAICYSIYFYILRRAFVRLADRSLALLVERRFSNLHESLLTAVELGEVPDHAEPFNREMLADTYRSAERTAGQLPLGSIFDRRPLERAGAVALLLAASLVVFSAAAGPALGIWARRSFLLSPELWPRQTHLIVEGFDSAGRMKIAKGWEVNLLVKADASPGAVVPESVEVRYRTSDGARARDRLNRLGTATPGPGEFQEYSYLFKSVLVDREFWIYGGDDRQGPYYLDVVDSPTLTKTVAHCEYPAYTHRTSRDLPMTGLVQLPRGTQVTIDAEANKPLVQVQLDVVSPDGPPVTHKIDLLAADGKPQSHFSFQLPALDSDKTLLCTLLDADGIRSRDPVRLSLGAVPDEAPQVNVQLEGIGTVITAAAQLPAVGEIVDDYGLAKVWFDFNVDDQPAQQQALKQAPAERNKLAVHESLEVGPLALHPKQKLHFTVQAADTFALADAPNQGSSQRYVLEVVTPEHLRAMLEARELMLRRRFETMIAEFTESRDLLARLELTEPKPADGAAAKEPSSKSPDKTAESSASKTPASGAEPGESNRAAAAKSPEQLLSARRVQVERVLQNSQRAAHETLEVAQAFDGIRAELVNNRVDTEELKTRLKDGIADPLRRIVAERFPGFEGRLRDLQAKLADPQAAESLKTGTVAQADKILVEMKQVLDRMLELETFNEVVDMLRSVIAAQEKLNDATKAQQKQKLRDLIDE
jgi:hypothetical protein